MRVYRSNYFSDLINIVTRKAAVAIQSESRDGDCFNLGPTTLILNNISNVGLDCSDINNSTFNENLLIREKALYFLEEDAVKYMPKYKKFCRPETPDICHSMYGKYIAGQIPKIIFKLSQYPNSRQAIIILGNNKLIEKNDKIDVPCTCLFKFSIRHDGLDYLDMTAVMRSNDIRLGLLYDVQAAVNLQQVIANTLKVQWGIYEHISLDTHLYARDYNYMLNFASKVKAAESINYNTYKAELIKSRRIIYGEK